MDTRPILQDMIDSRRTELSITFDHIECKIIEREIKLLEELKNAK